MADANKVALEEAYRAWHETKGGSVDRWLALMADDIDFRSLADGRGGVDFARNGMSKADMAEYFEGLYAQLEMIHYTVDRLICDGDTFVMVGSTSWRVRSNGRVFDTPKVDVVSFRGDRICAFYEYYDTAMVQACMTD